jgi:hypothetical protein
MAQLLAVVALVSAAAPSESDTLLRQIAETRNFNLGRPMAVGITPDEETVLFLRSPPKSGVSSLFAFDVATGRTREVLSIERTGPQLGGRNGVGAGARRAGRDAVREAERRQEGLPHRLQAHRSCPRAVGSGRRRPL